MQKVNRVPVWIRVTRVDGWRVSDESCQKAAPGQSKWRVLRRANDSTRLGTEGGLDRGSPGYRGDDLGLDGTPSIRVR